LVPLSTIEALAMNHSQPSISKMIAGVTDALQHCGLAGIAPPAGEG
jgi:hypothetical protein